MEGCDDSSSNYIFLVLSNAVKCPMFALLPKHHVIAQWTDCVVCIWDTDVPSKQPIRSKNVLAREDNRSAFFAVDIVKLLYVHHIRFLIG